MKASKKRRRSKTTELRPNNEDLGKNTRSLLIVWQAALQRSSSIFSSLSMPFTHFSQIGKRRGKKKSRSSGTGSAPTVKSQTTWMRLQTAACLTSSAECRRGERNLHSAPFTCEPFNSGGRHQNELRDQQTSRVQTTS